MINVMTELSKRLNSLYKNGATYMIILLVVVLGGAFFYFKVYLPKSTFRTIHPTVGKLDVKVFGIGEVNAKEIYPVSSQTGGKILTVETDQGCWVKKGDLLATVDPVDMPHLYAESRISATKARYGLLALQKELESLNAQKRLIRVTYERYERLQKQGYAAQAEYDKAKADMQSIDAQIAATLANVDSSKSEIARAEKSVDSFKEKLSRFKIYAPIDGFVIAKDAEVAQTLQVSQPIVRIVDPKTVWVKAYIDERISGKVAIGNTAFITLRSREGVSLSGHVARIATMSDAVTKEREVDVAFDVLPIPFYINEQAEVSIITETIDAIVKVPHSLLRQQNGLTGVWVLKEGRAHFQPLNITARGEDGVGVAEGLPLVSRLIVPDANKKPLSEGMRVYQ